MTTIDTSQGPGGVKAATAGDGSGTPADPTGNPGTPAVPTIDDIADMILGFIVKMEATVPDLRPPDPLQISRVAAAARYAQQLIPAAITTIESVTAVPNGLFDVEGGREALHYRDRLYPLGQRGSAFFDALFYSINARLAAFGNSSLQTYHWAKRAMNTPDGPAIQPYLDEMTRIVRKTNNKRKGKGTSKTPDPAPAPAPAPGPAPAPAPTSGPAPQGILPFRAHAEDDDFPRSIYDLVDRDAA
jgi:hypothetical protein